MLKLESGDSAVPSGILSILILIYPIYFYLFYYHFTSYIYFYRVVVNVIWCVY